MHPTWLVIAKAPRSGFVKTRLCPPCTPEQAAQIAEAALRDTIDAVDLAQAERRVLVLDGETPTWLAEDWEVRPQSGDGLDQRLAAAFASESGPTLLVGMDTPQLTPAHLDEAASQLVDYDAVIGPAFDGGFWLVGMREPDPGVFPGVPMSVTDTGRLQRQRLHERFDAVADTVMLADFDTWPDALAIAEGIPDTRFGVAIRRARGALPPGVPADGCDEGAAPTP